MNQLFYGDNLDVLRRKIADASVDLCYIDPPFNSKRNYFQIYNNQGGEDRAQAQAFVDTWEWGAEAVEGIAWLTDIEQLQTGKLTEQTVDLIRALDKILRRGSLLAYVVHMTLRIVEIHRVLKPTGSFYLHCDPTASHYLKLVLDAVFCGQGGDFVNEIIWKRADTVKGNTGQGIQFFDRNTDTILYYTKSTNRVFNPQFKPYTEKYLKDFYKYIEPKTKRRYRLISMTAPGDAAKGIQLDGVPRDMASAVALANRKDDKTRKEFEKWAVLTYSQNQARINEKKGADAGIDGVAYFLIDKDTNGKAIFQVKSGGAKRDTVATLNSDRQREKAEFGILITMGVPSKPMRDEVAAAGKYKHPLLNREDDRIHIVTVAEILAGARLELPMARADAVKSAEAADGRQEALL
jgi:DNA modification methylase